MPLTNAIHESLPYIDAEPTAAERTAAQKLITLELNNKSLADPEKHPSLPSLPPQTYSPLITQEFTRIENKEPLRAIDLKRYESLDAPETSDLASWRESLSRAYISQTYLRQRAANLTLLESHGKNAWLIGNSQLEDLLKDVERELAERKTEIDNVVLSRQGAQESVGGEIKGLEEAWKRGVGRVLETEVAAEGVRREVLERRREGAR